MTFKSLPHDLVVMVLDRMALDYTDLKDLTKGFPIGSYHRVDMEYRTETQRLLGERRAYFLEAIKANGFVLENIPEEYRDREMCLEAVKENGDALRYVPEELRDREMCLEAAKSWCPLAYVPEEFRDREMCLVAVNGAGHNLNYVPEKLRDREMCLVAVKRGGSNLAYVPDKLRDLEMCREAIYNPNAWRYVPATLHSQLW